MAVSKTTKASPKAAPKKTSTAKKVEHPSFLEMIKECIVENENKDEEPSVSRITIKKFLASNYKLDMTSTKNINSLNKAIENGKEKKILAFPKGPSGKIALEGKENVAPAKVSHKKGTAATRTTAAKAPAKKPLQPTGGSKSRPAKAAAPVKSAPAPTKRVASKQAALAPKKSAVPPQKKKAVTAQRKAAPTPKKKAAPAATKAAAKTKSPARQTKTSLKAEAAANPPKPKRGAPKQRS